MNLFTPNTDQIENFYEKGKFTLAWRLSMLFGIVFSILTLIFINQSIEEVLIYTTCTLLSITSLIYLKRTNKSQFIYYFLTISGTAIAMYSVNNMMQAVHFGDFLWIVLIIVIAYFGVGVKYGVVVLIFNALNVVYYTVFSVSLNFSKIPNVSRLESISLALEMVVAIVCISYVINQFLIFHNYSYSGLLKANMELKNQNEIILNQNKEKTTLVQEVHHRVKNNLQIIVSLLRLQKNEIKSDEAKKQFSEAINRIMVMSSIHQKLYNDKSFTEIVLKDYLTELTNDIITLSSKPGLVKIIVESEIKRIGLKTIVPLGLIINELVSNSIQHAFSEKNGVININFKIKENNLVELFYRDNGIWIEPKENYSSFGLELIDILTSQLDGDYKREVSETGTFYRFNLINVDL